MRQRPCAPLLLPLALLCLTCSAAMAAGDDELRQKIVGSWGDTAACAHGSLIFNADGSFQSKDAAQADNDFNGTYAIADGKLTGKTGDSEMPMMDTRFDGDTLVLTGGDGTPQLLVRCSAQ